MNNGRNARWAFSIWGVIFFFELVFVVWGAFPGNQDARVIQEGVGCWFTIACLVQVNAAAKASTSGSELCFETAATLT